MDITTIAIPSKAKQARSAQIERGRHTKVCSVPVLIPSQSLEKSVVCADCPFVLWKL